MGVTIGRVSQIESGDISGIDVLDRYITVIGGLMEIVPTLERTVQGWMTPALGPKAFRSDRKEQGRLRRRVLTAHVVAPRRKKARRRFRWNSPRFGLGDMVTRSRNDVVHCVVTKHVSYGVFVRRSDGEITWIEGDHINEERSIDAASWTTPGSELTAVVLGTTRHGRLWLASIPSFVVRIQAGERP